jgi:diacylglycerol kinase
MSAFLRSFKYAFAGILALVRTERNFKIILIAFVLVCAAASYFQITRTEWLVILLISALVITLEALNSAIEKVCDLITTETDTRIKTIKDSAAGAVLIASIFALGIACVIFSQYIG